jgi:hypothetical protein
MTYIYQPCLVTHGWSNVEQSRLDLMHNVFYIHQLVGEGIANYCNHMQGIIIDL